MNNEIRIKDFLVNLGGGKYGNDLNEDLFNIPCFSISDFKNGNISDTNKIIASRSYGKKNILPKGTILVEKSGGGEKTPVGRTVLVKKDINAYYTNFVIALKSKGCDIFAQYLLENIHNNRLHMAYVKQNTGLQNFDYTSFSNDYYVSIPLLPEQKSIATFLDQKTSLIDNKISILQERKKLILELEKSVINQVVTKGLQSFNLDMNGEKIDFNNDRGLSEIEFDAYMKECGYKDIGIEWFGYIKKSWDLSRLKEVFEFSKGKNAGKYSQEYIKGGNNAGIYPVYSGQTKDNGIMGNISTWEYDKNEIIFVTTVGAKAMENKLLKGKFSLSQNCALMELNEKNNTSYFNYLLQIIFNAERIRIPTIITPSLRIEDLNIFFNILPLKKEQDQIATFLDKKTSQFKKQISNIEKEIELLKEFRKTVINDVVTGKIKVVV